MKKLVVALTILFIVGLTAQPVTAQSRHPISNMGDVGRYLDQVKDQIDSINVMHDTLAVQSDEAFDSTAAFCGDVRVWVGNAETYIKGCDDVFDNYDQVFDTVSVYLEGIDQVLDTTAVHFANLDQVLDTLAVYLNATDVILDTLPAYVAGVDQALDTIYVYLGLSDQALDTLAVYMASIKLTVDSLVAKFNDHLNADSLHGYALTSADSMTDAIAIAQRDTIVTAAKLAAYAWANPSLNWVDPDTLGVVATTDFAWVNPAYAWANPAWAWIDPDSAVVTDDLTDFIGTAGAVTKIAVTATAIDVGELPAIE